MFKNFNPIWIPFLTIWIPSQIARIPMENETLKTIIIWTIILVQGYFLFQGINYIKNKNQAGEKSAGSKKDGNTGKAK